MTDFLTVAALLALAVFLVAPLAGLWVWVWAVLLNDVRDWWRGRHHKAQYFPSTAYSDAALAAAKRAREAMQPEVMKELVHD